MGPRRSRWQILTWTIVLTAMATTLTVLWNVVIVRDYLRLRELSERAANLPGGEIGARWILFALGVVFLVAIVIGLLMLGIKLYKEVDYSQRQSNFIAGVTHEFKSPLAGIRLNTETLLTREMSPEDQTRFLRGILSETERLGRLVENILSAGKIDLQGLDLSAHPEDLASAVRSYYRSRVATMSAQGVTWRMEIGETGTLMVDPATLHNVLDNLVENAVKYSEGEKVVTLEATVEGPTAILRVRDEGIGIDPEDMAHLTERFFRGKHQPKRRVPGTGLGLFLVEHMVKAQRGEVAIYSGGRGQGTVAVVRLPLMVTTHYRSPEVA